MILLLSTTVAFEAPRDRASNEKDPVPANKSKITELSISNPVLIISFP